MVRLAGAVVLAVSVLSACASSPAADRPVGASGSVVHVSSAALTPLFVRPTRSAAPRISVPGTLRSGSGTQGSGTQGSGTQGSGTQGCSGFALSLAAGTRGSADPLTAARTFLREGGVSGFGTSTSRWTLHTRAALVPGSATVTEGSVSLHATQLPDKTWVIDSGERCG
ncbi:hypothetical protein [Nakamurella sp. PAMC28650]|uniref:hypothetical protein n=1 Tax=Nakamurella sp. PAMC28650 TaxID=2762325 RepID=UPI00164E62B9|nr:hypothetical protein [Nakamurella sp. PAMC28650]QNK81634.1 hypothetical protein H7F38_02045 [Nakamurella sp. PAMC28650]